MHGQWLQDRQGGGQGAGSTDAEERGWRHGALDPETHTLLLWVGSPSNGVTWKHRVRKEAWWLRL